MLAQQQQQQQHHQQQQQHHQMLQQHQQMPAQPPMQQQQQPQHPPPQQMPKASPAPKVTKKRTRKDPNSPKRAMSAYFMYVQKERQEMEKRGEKISKVSHEDGIGIIVYRVNVICGTDVRLLHLWLFATRWQSSLRPCPKGGVEWPPQRKSLMNSSRERTKKDTRLRCVRYFKFQIILYKKMLVNVVVFLCDVFSLICQIVHSFKVCCIVCWCRWWLSQAKRRMLTSPRSRRQHTLYGWLAGVNITKTSMTTRNYYVKVL